MAPAVTEFYEGKSILVTGATGFVGKALVEKLLRSCPGVKTIYLLMRQKKGQTSEERLNTLSNNVIFNSLTKKQPEVLKKLKLIRGDILEDGLGLFNDDRQDLITNCNIVFHSAACVRFDQKLKDAVETNTVGTHRVLKLAESMINLEAFVHLSTTFCHCYLDVLEEKVYPAVHKPRQIMEMVEWMDDSMLKFLEPKLISSEPNTYSYTKAITEELVAEYGCKFPVAIGRPSVVTAAWREPIPGWVDNLNGATGLLIGCGKGVIRTMHCESSYKTHVGPVDVVVNACIVIAYAIGLDKPRETRVYNITTSEMNTITWKDVVTLGRKWLNVYPFTIALWYPGGSIKSYWWTHQLMLFLTHIVPAYLVDFLLILFRQKTFLVKVQKRISQGLSVIQFYTTKDWIFKKDNFLALQKRITKEENEIFFTDSLTADMDLYIRDYIRGAREYVCKEDPSNLPRARKLHIMRYVLDLVVKGVLCYFFAWFLYSNCGPIKAAVTSADFKLCILNC